MWKGWCGYDSIKAGAMCALIQVEINARNLGWEWWRWIGQMLIWQPNNLYRKHGVCQIVISTVKAHLAAVMPCGTGRIVSQQREIIFVEMLLCRQGLLTEENSGNTGISGVHSVYEGCYNHWDSNWAEEHGGVGGVEGRAGGDVSMQLGSVCVGIVFWCLLLMMKWPWFTHKYSWLLRRTWSPWAGYNGKPQLARKHLHKFLPCFSCYSS